MKIHWKIIIFEVILEILLELAPVGLSIMATISEYLVELSLEHSRVSADLVINSMKQQYTWTVQIPTYPVKTDIIYVSY